MRASQARWTQGQGITYIAGGARRVGMRFRRQRTAPCGSRPAKTKDRHMADKQTSLQDLFLNALRKSKTPVTMFLVKGVKLQGIVTWFDNFSVLLRRDGQSQLIYKHAISAIRPSTTIAIEAHAG